MRAKLLFTGICLIISILFSQSIKAQNNLYLIVHGMAGVPMDKSSKNRYSAGAGGETGIQYGKKNTFVAGTVGYASFFSKTATDEIPDYGNLSYIPVRLGIRHNLAELFYIHGDAGVGFVKNKDLENSDQRFSFDVGAGVRLSSFEVELVVDAFKEIDPDGWSSWIGLKAGWRIGL